jgi:hypothetical protein
VSGYRAPSLRIIAFHGKAEVVNSIALAVFRGDISAAAGEAETTGWNELRVGSSVLGRVVSFSQKPCFCGIHPRSMPRSSAALVAHRARELVARGRPVPEGTPIPVAWMQEEGTAEMLVDLWDYVVANSAPGPSRKSVSSA